jgi:Ca2+-binding RTX toxin-like protein
LTVRKLGSVMLDGGSGSDRIRGGTSNDMLVGGTGNDTLIGGAGADRFVYDTNATFTTSAVGSDRISDFTLGSDKIVIDRTTFTALTSAAGNGFSVASEFAVVSSDADAATTGALITYSSATGNLFYHQNGSAAGLGSGAMFATLSSSPALTVADFVIQM